MESTFLEFIFLILIILFLVMLANKLRVAYPIVLVIGGLILSFAPVFSNLEIDPRLIFFIFLPPLLYEASWEISWKEFWRFRRVILSFAFPIVILTSCVIAIASSAIIPGFTLAMGFLLGGIISPPDAISATAIMRRVNVSKRMVGVAEGESLVNDASSLIVYRFALAAIITGQFHFQEAALSFVLVIVVGTLIGLLVALGFYAMHRYLPLTPSIEVVLTLLTPYCMYYFAELFHFSGVLAVVAGGLFLSQRRNKMLSYQSRIQGINVWSNLVFVLNGLVFMLIGLQMPSIANKLGNEGLSTGIWYALAISLVLIISRLLCAFGASIFTTFMSRFIKVQDAHPGFRAPLVLGWAGMRGVVSLAAALSIPVALDNGQPFPHRDLILFITFVVILVTLVFQGLTLPWVIRQANVRERNPAIPERLQEKMIQSEMNTRSLEYLNRIQKKFPAENQYLRNLNERINLDLKLSDSTGSGESSNGDLQAGYFRAYLGLLDEHRAVLEELNKDNKYDEDIIRKYQVLIDIEEYKVRGKQIN